MSTDTVSTYFPDFISSETLQEVRARLQAYLGDAWPDVDMRPNSVFGDLVLTPATHLVAAMEESINRLLSDMDLANVANGVVYNCDFVQEYIKLFRADQDQLYESYGVLRAWSSTDIAITIGREARFAAGTSVFRLRLAEAGGLTINQVGTPRTLGENTLSWVQGPSGGYYVDLPVLGTMNEDVINGTQFLSSFEWTDLIRLTALTDFTPAYHANTLSDQARQTRTTFFAATPSTRQGLRAFLLREFPGLVGAYVACPGDAAQTRGTTNALGISTPVADAFVRSKDDHMDTFVVRAWLDVEEDKFVGLIEAPSEPYLLESVAWVEDTDTEYVFGEYTGLLSAVAPTDNDAAPDWACGHTDKRKLYFILPMPEVEGVDAISTSVHESAQYADFVVKMRVDPMFRPMMDTLASTQNRLIGVDTLFRGPVVVRLNSITVNFRKFPGAEFKQTQARKAIAAYINGAAWPDTISESQIIDEVYYAGASGVDSISCDGVVFWSPATNLLPDGSADPLVDLTTALSELVAAPSLTFPTVQTLRNTHNAGSHAYYGPEVSRIVVDEVDVKLVEV
jgi:hypothetical protein